MINQLFHNRVAVLGTMHHKEKVIAPLLERELGLKVILPDNFNTDIWGTFTRDVERPGTQIDVVRWKAQAALDITGSNLAIASEGSFAPHPSLPYLYSNREIVILLDQENDLEIIGEEFSLETNFNHQTVNNLQAAEDFAVKIGFPEHGLVISFNHAGTQEIIKGINTAEQFLNSVNIGLSKSTNGEIFIETDMRALYNPTRMKNIEKATLDLLNKIKSICPNCAVPGFVITERIPGLLCRVCHLPTSLINSVIYQCKKCGFHENKPNHSGKELADPSQCNYCNP